MSDKPLGDLPYRTLINGVSALLLGVFILYAEGPFFRWLFAGGVAMIAATALWEYYELLRKKGLSPAAMIGLITVVFYVFAVFFKTQGPRPLFEPLWQQAPEILLGLGFLASFVFFAVKNASPITNIATTFWGIVYIGVPLGLVLRITYFFLFGGRVDPHLAGSWWLLYVIAVTKSADMGGYFIGGQFGKRKLAHKLSPNKTLEGALGGLVSAVAISLLITYLGRTLGQVFWTFSYGHAAILGGLVGVVGQLGDLAESLLKRDAGVKDSNTLPGVGGLLDMVDSILFAAPVVYFFLRIHYT